MKNRGGRKNSFTSVASKYPLKAHLVVRTLTTHTGASGVIASGSRHETEARDFYIIAGDGSYAEG